MAPVKKTNALAPVPTVGQQAKALGMSKTAVEKARQRGMPADIEGGRAWRAQQQEKQGGKLAEAQRRKLEAEAQLKEYELAEKMGEMVSVDHAAEEFDRILDQLRSNLVAIPGKYAPRVVGLRTMAEAVTVLEQMVADLMHGMMSVADDVSDPSDRAA